MAPHNVSTVAIIGAGIQARTQALALIQAVDSVSTIRISSRNPIRRQEFADALRGEISRSYPGRSVEVVASESVQAACHGAGIVVAATTSTTPVVRDEWLEPNVLVCGVGSHAPSAAEIDMPIVERARRIVVDTHAGAIDGAGDIQAAIAAGRINRSDVTELGALLSEPPEASNPRDGTTVFKSVGFSAADIFSARLVARRAALDGDRSRFDLHK